MLRRHIWMLLAALCLFTGPQLMLAQEEAPKTEAATPDAKGGAQPVAPAKADTAPATGAPQKAPSEPAKNTSTGN